ncbi:Arabinanase/levansucrase/invertase [Microthyrium microscopicum]|uniref:Arabinanase/levansucrase/invertase n=1 Tax=Microthyrium microscopicum TaxID=703497 RepID=A0A6A6UKI0_9PEZI|nr:Arabinanase/levansucrase/invertase [Microthyrium microscopicum]
MAFNFVFIVLACLCAVQRTLQLQIVPGATLTAVNTGQHVQAHGAGFIKVGDLYYMIGEDKASGSNFQNVNCYSSPNLAEWTYVGALVSRGASGDLGPGRVVERPKVIYNRQTKKYVLYMHIDSGNYKEAKVGVATGDTVCGKYTYHGSYRPQGHQSRDMGLFQDTDGTGYLLAEDREAGLRIFQLSADYMNVTALTYLWKEKYEAPAILKRGSTYYMFASHLSGWNSNDNIYSTATKMTGPWSGWKTFAPSGSKTLNSQTAYILTPDENTAIYMGDRWIEKDLSRSTYVWHPLKVNGNTVTMENHEYWNPPVGATGQAGQEVTYAAKDAILKSVAKMSNGAAGYIGGPDNGSITFSAIRSSSNQRRTLKIYYGSGDKAPRYASVTVNDDKPQKVQFLSTESGRGISVVSVDLRAGKNTITISSFNGGWGPDIASLKVAE